MCARPDSPTCTTRRRVRALSIDSSREGSAVLTPADPAPGRSRSGVFDMKYASSMDATLALALSNVTGPTPAGSLSLPSAGRDDLANGTSR